ncbi:MAG: thioredoxin family protein [Spirosomataceae bacterium]
MKKFVCLIIFLGLGNVLMAQEMPDTTIKAIPLTLTELEKIVKENKLVVADFHADWCGPCRKMLPSFAQLKKEFEGKAVFLKIHHDLSKPLVQYYGIDEIPTMLVFKNKKMVNRLIGYMDANTMRTLLKDSFAKVVE